MAIIREDSVFVIHDPRNKRWALPYHYESICVRGKVLLEEQLDCIKGKTVLDLGCYFGTWAYYSYKLGAKAVMGIDADEDMIKKANQYIKQEENSAETITFEVSEVLKYLKGLSDKSVDTVLCFGLLYYIQEPFQLLKEMSRVARSTILLDTFTAFYCAVQGKDSVDIISKTRLETFDLPLLFYQLTKKDKVTYSIPHAIQQRKKRLSFIVCPTITLLNLYFQALGVNVLTLDWTSYIRNPEKKWQDLISKKGKEDSHWTDIYATHIRMSYRLELD